MVLHVSRQPTAVPTPTSLKLKGRAALPSAGTAEGDKATKLRRQFGSASFKASKLALPIWSLNHRALPDGDPC